MPFIQSDKISDVVIPLMRCKKTNNYYQYEELYGTGFLVGNRGFGVTCAHVIEQLVNDLDSKIIATYFVSDSEKKIYPFEISEYEIHTSEDIAVFRVDCPNLKSWMMIDSSPQNSSFEYQAWGYPRIIAMEAIQLDSANPETPVLIYTQGYFRRRIDRPLYPAMIFRGQTFYEVSELGGSGYSGSPIINKRRTGDKWPVVGIYVGERDTDGVSVGYAVNSQCFFAWTPKILGRSILDEANNVK